MNANPAGGAAVTWQYTQPDSDDRMHSVVAAGASKGEWVEIQERAFTAWVNKQLRKLGEATGQIASLQDLRTGVMLLRLVEAVCGVTLRVPSSAFNMRIHHLSNVDRALTHLTQRAGLTLVNIGAADVVDGHRDIMLGLIWTLIQKYELRLSRSDLLGWVRDMVAAAPGGVRVNNFSTDWNSGRALCALVSACAPAAGIDPESLPDDAVGNNARAMAAAAAHLHVAPILSAEDIASPAVDELSVMTYVASINAAHPQGPPEPPRPAGFEHGLFVEVVRGPESTISMQQGDGGQRALVYRPHDGRGGYEVRIYWRGRLLQGMPAMVGAEQ